MKTVIFDLDGTLADITKRREMSTKENGKIDWDIFFTPENIWFDTPNDRDWETKITVFIRQIYEKFFN